MKWLLDIILVVYSSINKVEIYHLKYVLSCMLRKLKKKKHNRSFPNVFNYLKKKTIASRLTHIGLLFIDKLYI